MIVGCICEAEDGRVLLCRRAIAPQRGFWTFPSGFLECGESGIEGAIREAREETGADVEVEGLLCVIDVPQMSEVHLVYRGHVRSTHSAATAESDQVRLLAESEIPWGRLAFSSVEFGLKRFFHDRAQGRTHVHIADLRSEGLVV
jgi:ADP-ribose pyrophosphatase YjhB (NUDIX family)